jgi:CRISPR-associated protein Cas6
VYWQEDSDESQPYKVPDDILDVSYRISCQSLPVDHAYALSAALTKALSWLEEEEQAGIHLIHGAESGNGWIRPEDPQALMYLSRRTRMTLRLPKERVDEAKLLTGSTLDVGGNALTVGRCSIRPLSHLTTIFARYVITDDVNDESSFIEEVVINLKDIGIKVKKMMGGRLHTFNLPGRKITTRSLMIDGLKVQESVSLQQQGLGPGRKIGCGLFLPHKGIDAVTQSQNK